MFLDWQQNIARQWMGLAEANMRAATDMMLAMSGGAGGGARPAERALALSPGAMMAPWNWPWPGHSTGGGAGAMWPGAGLTGFPGLSPFAFAGPMAAAALWSWPLLAAWQRAAAPLAQSLPMAWSAPQPGGWPMVPGVTAWSDAVAAAFRSSSGFAAAAIVIPLPRVEVEPTRSALPWPFALWDAFLPRR